MEYILFVVGFVLLIKGADYLVEGASSIAKRYHISDLIIGLTIVSFGTSLPELIVNLSASVKGSSQMAIGNVFGSNIANILLILGVSSMIRPLPITRNIYFSEIPFSLVATLLVGFLANASLDAFILDTQPAVVLSHLDGVILLFFFALFMGYIFAVASSNRQSLISIEQYHQIPVNRSVLMIVGGLAGLYFGGEWVVAGGVSIAESFGLSESFIGLTVIAIGTSLPELVTSAVAAYKNNTDIAVGNVVGSNIFNMLWILGISALIKPLPFDTVNNIDILMIILSSTLLLFAVAVGKGTRIVRWEGVLFLLVYVLYMIYLVDRG